MTDAADLTALEMLHLFSVHKLSPREVMAAVAARVEALDGTLNATWGEDFETAMEEAAASEARWMAGAPIGPLDGVPLTVKEMIATRGHAKPVGTAAGDMTPQTVDAPPAARCREAGAIIFAKTTNPDYGMLSSGLSSFHKLARNPWDITRTPGGSSSGAAAASAAGYGPLHIGTDIGGSVRLPAGWCGTFTLKPSNGRIPIDPPFIGRVAGPMTRTVEDSALMMSVLSQPDERDYMSLPPVELPWRELGCDLAGLRIGLMMDAGVGLPVEADVAKAVREAAALFEKAGAVIEEVPPVMDREMLDGLDVFWRTRFLAETAALSRDLYELILPYIRAWGEGARGLDGIAVYRGFSQIIRIREAGARAFSGFDFMLSPTAPITAFAAELPGPTNDPARPFEHIGFTVAYNMTEQPAASINCGYDNDGLPIGLQIIGKRFDDVGVLGLSKAYEMMRPAQRAWPTLGPTKL